MAAGRTEPAGPAPAALHARLDALADALVAEILALAAIPAPSFEEQERAAYVAARFREAGLRDVAIDGAGNVRGRLSGAAHPAGRALLVAAHIDTVYPRAAHEPPRRDGGRLVGSSIRDNSAGAAALVILARALRDAGVALPCAVEFVATTGEEGLGDLRGMRYRLRPEEARPDAVLAVDGPLGQIVHQGIAVRRFAVRFETAGGHSWSQFGEPSAIHHLARVIDRLAAAPVPAAPKTTLNVGVVRGGTSVNSIAASAEMQVDFRSLDVAPVDRLSETLRGLVAAEEQAGVRASVTIVGDRPGGAIPADHPLVAAVRGGYLAWGVEPRLTAASTDANIPLALGIPAVSAGVSSGGNTHAPGEWLEIESLRPGIHALAENVARVAEWVAGRN
ncbi:MAG TPA: M20/M25/M40 family metallo-hydrolase [bacterium]|nr:M20/M25/M40 family metallo-hydrolase [bacterium]